MNAIETFSKKEPFYLHVKARTWNRDSHGLFDYENNTVKSNNYVLTKSGFIIRKKHEVKFVTSKEEANGNEDKELFEVSEMDGNIV